jgi:hypothetical protein
MVEGASMNMVDLDTLYLGPLLDGEYMLDVALFGEKNIPLKTLHLGTVMATEIEHEAPQLVDALRALADRLDADTELECATGGAVEQHLTVSSNLSEMLGDGEYTDRQRDIAAKSFAAGVREGREQVASGGTRIARELLKELSALAILIDFGDDSATGERINALISRAKGEAL